MMEKDAPLRFIDDQIREILSYLENFFGFEIERFHLGIERGAEVSFTLKDRDSDTPILGTQEINEISKMLKSLIMLVERIKQDKVEKYIEIGRTLSEGKIFLNYN